MWKNRLKSESKALTYHYFLPSCTEPDKQALKYLLEKRGGNRRKREKRKMTYVNNMFFIKDLAFWSHRHNIQYKIHISCKMALMKWKPTAGIFLWSRLCEINTFWRSLSNSILNFISQSLIDEIYHHFHWTLFKVSETTKSDLLREGKSELHDIEQGYKYFSLVGSISLWVAWCLRNTSCWLIMRNLSMKFLTTI